ncbi:MAG TPA: hypothetical protein VFK78_04995 [Gemmatimonadales bacterium]|nr:hypothetical protein [Gemmatimonadales bacterium]
MRTAAVAVLLAVGCASGGPMAVPGSLKGYQLVVPPESPFQKALASALKHRGFKVRDAIRGGGRPAAALFSYVFREPPTGKVPGPAWLHVRVADTRSGVIVAAVTLPLDSLPADPARRAEIVADSLLARAREAPAAGS